MSDEQRNDGLHPRHPGRGKPTALIRLEGDKVEQGGFLLFLPSGLTKQVAWHSPKPITPTLDAAKEYTGRVIEDLLKQGNDDDDVRRTNWTSVCAAVQRIVLDFNDRVSKAINTKMARDLMLPSEKRWLQ
jgi:hypothetical protein